MACARNMLTASENGTRGTRVRSGDISQKELICSSTQRKALSFLADLLAQVVWAATWEQLRGRPGSRGLLLQLGALLEGDS